MTAIVSKTPLRQVTQVRELLANEQARAQLASVAAAHMSPERMMRLMALAIDKTPTLAKCSPMSVLGALMTCSSLGLEPNTVLGHAYLIPFKNGRKSKEARAEVYEVQLVIGYRGFVALGHNSGEIAFIDAGVHYSDDPVWRYRKGSEQILEHEPGPEQGKKLHAYAVVGLKNGGTVVVCWPWEKVIAHRDRYSKGWQDAVKYGKTDKSPWSTAEDAMAMKTMIRQLTKFMPMSSERLTTAVSIDGGNVDYAAFAMNPVAGLPPAETGDDAPIEGDVIDAEDGEDDRAAVPEPEKKAQAAESKPQPDPMAEVRARAQAAARVTGARRDDDPPPPMDPTTKKAAAKAEPATVSAEVSKEVIEDAEPNEPDFTGIIQTITNDMLDLEPERAAEALDFYPAEVERLKAEAPKQWHALMVTISERENTPAEGGE